MKLPNFSPEHRSTYRVAVEGTQSTLWIGLSSGPLKVRLDDVSARGCGFTCDSESGSSLVVGDELVLRLRVGLQNSPQLFIRSEIRVLRPRDGELRVGVAFNDCERLYQQLDLSQWLYFNRRGAFRVPPANHRGEPLRASFYDHNSTKELRFTVHDLSSSGLAIRLPGKQEFTLSKTRPLRTTFELPGVGDLLDLRLGYVHCTSRHGVERVGMKFDPVATKNFEAQSERILGYVLERQGQLLRA